MFHFPLIVSEYLPGAKIKLICLWLESRDDSPCTSHLGVILALSNPTPHSLPIKLSSLNFPYSISSENPYLMRTAPQNQTMKFPPYLTDYGHKYSSTLHPPYIKKKNLIIFHWYLLFFSRNHTNPMPFHCLAAENLFIILNTQHHTLFHLPSNWQTHLCTKEEVVPRDRREWHTHQVIQWSNSSLSNSVHLCVDQSHLCPFFSYAWLFSSILIHFPSNDWSFSFCSIIHSGALTWLP